MLRASRLDWNLLVLIKKRVYNVRFFAFEIHWNLYLFVHIVFVINLFNRHRVRKYYKILKKYKEKKSCHLNERQISKELVDIIKFVFFLSLFWCKQIVEKRTAKLSFSIHGENEICLVWSSYKHVLALCNICFHFLT